ncbi:MAG: TonB-dependent receptor, partial [Prevotella sp.]|nr:TonB-dependent receptor [Prevotella sp.]
MASKDSLAEDGHSLDGVTVTAQRQLIKQEVDRIGYDVQADEGSKTQNVMDMLRKVPMVTVDAQDNILVKGSSNYRIYKNGHPDPSLSKNAKEIFKALPAASVKRIEVITDPGAREDAEGVGSILNIVMMDTRNMEGVTGNLTAGYSSLKHTNLGAYLATQLGKLILSFDYGYGGMSKKGTENSGLPHRNYVKTGNASDYSIHSTNAGSVHY